MDVAQIVHIPSQHKCPPFLHFWLERLPFGAFSREKLDIYIKFRSLLFVAKRREYPVQMTINQRRILAVVIDPHYEEKHGGSIDD